MKETLPEALARLEKWGSPVRTGAGLAPVSVFETGVPGLDAALGCGGLPYGRIVEVYGPEASGKTTVLLALCSAVQKAGGVAAFVDAEHGLDVDYARRVGVDIGRLLVAQPQCGEDSLEITETLARTGGVHLVVVDSVAALTPRTELDGGLDSSGTDEDYHVGRLLSLSLRRLCGVASRSGCTIVFANQLRRKWGVTFGSPEKTVGGNALKFFSSVRLDIRRTGSIKAGEQAVGQRTKIKVVKNKLAAPYGVAEPDLRFGFGFRSDVSEER